MRIHLECASTVGYKPTWNEKILVKNKENAIKAVKKRNNIITAYVYSGKDGDAFFLVRNGKRNY